ncbi:hypothetical protein [Shouchella lonarensis]|uniref:Uncharacterized protein n=1 Tax=Shouchella lonarensis TaxID=1464122 RepID=A0A1G6HZU3_9BACI|nr:hypothetical protein [Shouchella lonarensis]SDB99345.1 hypothetical protein SAMN05421737_104237 [Shouchella lonarensis]
MFWKKWWKTIVMIIGIIALTVGGIVLANHMSKTGDIALDDTFTSKFIDRSVKVDDGFHFFESQNGHYTMWFPSGYYLSDAAAMYITKDHYEVLSMYEKREEGEPEDVFAGVIFTTYSAGEETDQDMINLDLRILLKDVSYNGQHEKVETDDTIIYYGSSHHGLEGKKGVFSNPKDSYANQYFALIQNKGGNQSVTVKYSLYCADENESACGNNGEKEASFFDTFIRNIKFR